MTTIAMESGDRNEYMEPPPPLSIVTELESRMSDALIETPPRPITLLSTYNMMRLLRQSKKKDEDVTARLL